MASLDPGKRLGPYEIIAAIGAGGMGEVYRARDSRIGRDVAIKILPAEYSENQDRLARFEHEARAAGMLNHPNILAVYDVGSENGCSYLVTELLEGETLRHKLEQGALPTRKALEYATQLAVGLAAAHQKGIVHRDLKPENIFLTRDGRLKILDFGLAKLIQPELLPANNISNMATGVPQSQPGMILGTIGYMSPEQVRGQNADSRSDLFTFGEILYEMLAGKRAFQGQTSADTMSAILHKDVAALPQQPELTAPERILRRCLEKDPAQRFQSAQDLAFALEALSGSSGSQTSLQGTAFTAPSKTRLYPWIIAALLFLAAIAAWGSRLLEKKAPASLIQLELMAPKDHVLNGIPVISPDGSAIALTATNKNGDSTLWVRSFDSSILREMIGTEGAATPFWSADSRSIGFFAQGKLKKIQIPNGPAQDLSEAPDLESTGCNCVCSVSWRWPLQDQCWGRKRRSNHFVG
jgi:eukaryotic-like serine/threonine-protein kinase